MNISYDVIDPVIHEWFGSNTRQVKLQWPPKINIQSPNLFPASQHHYLCELFLLKYWVKHLPFHCGIETPHRHSCWWPGDTWAMVLIQSTRKILPERSGSGFRNAVFNFVLLIGILRASFSYDNGPETVISLALRPWSTLTLRPWSTLALRPWSTLALKPWSTLALRPWSTLARRPW